VAAKLISAALAAVVLAGCSSEHYSIDQVERCLDATRENPRDPSVFPKGSEGNLKKHERQLLYLYLAFGRDNGEAKGMLTALDDANFIIGVKNGTDVSGNVLYWVNATSFPSDVKEQVRRCLEESG
jgi:hypothetical protein